MKQIATATSQIFGVSRAQLFGFTQHSHPIHRRMHKQGFILQVQIHLFELNYALGHGNQLVKHCQPDRITHFQPMPGSERQWLPVTLQEGNGTG